MNEKLFRTQFNQMETTEKQALMESLAARYDMTFLGLHTFDRWGQNCTTGIFKKDGREFVFVPGDTVTLGWEQFAVGLNQESREELEYLFREWEMEPQNPEEMIRESMAPVRQAAIGPMLVGRVTYVNGDTQEFTDAEAFLKCVREELPYRPTTGFRYEVLTDDPTVRKQVDDMIFDFYGEEAPCRQEDHEPRSEQGMTFGGM